MVLKVYSKSKGRFPGAVRSSSSGSEAELFSATKLRLSSSSSTGEMLPLGGDGVGALAWVLCALLAAFRAAFLSALRAAFRAAFRISFRFCCSFSSSAKMAASAFSSSVVLLMERVLEHPASASGSREGEGTGGSRKGEVTGGSRKGEGRGS